jgi:hypothetical protein
MAQGLEPVKSLSVRTGYGIGTTTAAEYVLPGRNQALGSIDSCYSAAVNRKSGGPGIEPHRDPALIQITDQSIPDITGPVTYGKHPLTPLNLGLDPSSLKELDDIPNPKGSQSREQELPQPAILFDQLLVVKFSLGDIASPLASDQEFDPQLAVLFQQHHRFSQFGSPSGRHHAGWSPTDHCYIEFLMPVPHLIILLTQNESGDIPLIHFASWGLSPLIPLIH